MRDLCERVHQRRQAVRVEYGIKSCPGGVLVRGRNARAYSRHLFGGLMTCGICGATVGIVSGGRGSSRYGCCRSCRVGSEACGNRLTIRSKIADAALLGGLQGKLLLPDTLQYVTEVLAAALNRRHPTLSASSRELTLGALAT